MKKCPFCSEEIQDDAIKCKHCWEFLQRKDFNYKDFEIWLKKTYPVYNICPISDKTSNIITISKTFKNINAPILILLLLLWIIPGVIYAILGQQKTIFITIEFDENGKSIKNIDTFDFIRTEYNQWMKQQENIKILWRESLLDLSTPIWQDDNQRTEVFNKELLTLQEAVKDKLALYPEGERIYLSTSKERLEKLQNISIDEVWSEIAEKARKNAIILLWTWALIATIIVSIGTWPSLTGSIFWLIVLWLHPRKWEVIFINRLKKLTEYKLRYLFSIILLFLVLVDFGSFIQFSKAKEPVIRILTQSNDRETLSGGTWFILPPTNNSLMVGDKRELTLEFSAENSEKVLLNDEILQWSGGIYSKRILLNSPTFNATISAENSRYKSKKEVTIIRNKTNEESKALADTEKAKKESETQKIAQLEAEKKQKAIEIKRIADKELAEQKAYEKTKAGRICKTHPNWTKEDCESLANNKIWIGMSYDMLVYSMGKPSSANPSNYWNGTQWQWCWSNYNSPSCFYDNDNDGLVDSYN